ncbi:MAG: response regulator [Anaerolineaceae bacterium]|nr:response regulator [Anaerolineaceae bacterium]
MQKSAYQSRIPILLVSEDRILSDLVVLGLEKAGCWVTISNTPAEFFNLLESIKPCIVLLDLFLSGWNGLEILEVLKILGWLEKTHVIAISGMGYKEIVNKAVSLGAVDFQLKPIDLDELAKRIKKWVQISPKTW